MLECPTCGKNMHYDTDFQMMYCAGCGGLELPRVFVLEEDSTPESQVMKENVDAIQEENPSEFFCSQKTVEYCCESCGAILVTDNNTVATFCLYCGNSVIIPQRITDHFQPDYVIPFAYDQKEMQKKFLRWSKKGLLTPRDFIGQGTLKKITGMYIPYWLFDYQVNMDILATGIRSVEDQVSSNAVKTVAYYNLIRKKQLGWEKIPFDGSRNIDSSVAQGIEPYDFSQIKNFDMKYLSGFFANKYDCEASEFQEIVENQIKKQVHKVFEDSLKDFIHVTIQQDNSEFIPFKPKYALVPVWFLNYHYRKKTYPFVMNGQTGTIYGKLPFSPLKIFVTNLSFLARLMIILSVIFLYFSLFFSADYEVRQENPLNPEHKVIIEDLADLFSESEEQQMYQTIKQKALKQNINIVVSTVNSKAVSYSNDQLGSEQYAADQYARLTEFEEIYDNSGFLLLIDMEYRYVYFYTFDRVAHYVSNSKCISITENIKNYLAKGNYFIGTREALTKITKSYALDYPFYFGIFSLRQLIFMFIMTIIGYIGILIYLFYPVKNKKIAISNDYRVALAEDKEYFVDKLQHSHEIITRNSSDDSGFPEGRSGGVSFGSSGGFGGGGGGGGGSRSGGGGSRF